MPVPTDPQELTELFRSLGCPRPAGWADSQSNEGINQLHRFLFLRQAWQQVITEDDERWIEREIGEATRSPAGPYAGVGHALSRLIELGASRSDIVDLVRGMQAQTLFGICYLLDDPSISESDASDLGWTMVESTEEGEPSDRPIEGLHESVLDTDPTGREMRPRNPADPGLGQ